MFFINRYAFVERKFCLRIVRWKFAVGEGCYVIIGAVNQKENMLLVRF